MKSPPGNYYSTRDDITMTKTEMWVSVTRCYAIREESGAEDSVNHAGPIGGKQQSAVSQLHDCLGSFMIHSNVTGHNEIRQTKAFSERRLTHKDTESDDVYC